MPAAPPERYRIRRTAQSFSPPARGWTTNHPHRCPDYAVTFVHEIGHGLGAHHDPGNVYESGSRGQAVRLRPCGPGRHAEPRHGDECSGPCRAVLLDSAAPALGRDSRHRGRADNERTLRETVHIAVQYSDYLRSLGPAPPSDLRVRFEGGGARLTWRDNAPDADGYEVEYVGGGTFRRQMVKDRTGAVLPLESTEPGTHYDFLVRAIKGDERSLRSNIVLLVVPGDPIAAPSDVSVTHRRMTFNQIDVRWTDNSDNESGFDVQLLQDGDPIHRNRVAADSEYSSFDSFLALWVNAQGGAEYGVRVFAFNPSGYSESSEVVTFRWELSERDLGPVTGFSVRVPPGRRLYASHGQPTRRRGDTKSSAVLRGWRDERSWRSGSQNVSAGTAWMDFEGLPRGGRYGFKIVAARRPATSPEFALPGLSDAGRARRGSAGAL